MMMITKTMTTVKTVTVLEVINLIVLYKQKTSSIIRDVMTRCIDGT